MALKLRQNRSPPALLLISCRESELLGEIGNGELRIENGEWRMENGD
jgi:hypothetical protein